MKRACFHHLIIGLTLSLWLLQGCSVEESADQKEINNTDPAWVQDMWLAHGELNDYSFDFRGANYSFRHHEGGFRYTKLLKTDSTNQFDVLTDEGFTRVLNGDTLALDEEKSAAYGEILNSVVYFVCLPQKLKDGAVNMRDMGQTSIKDENYHVLKVSFEEQGGGTDFEDEFMYWVNSKTNFVDYFAYRYHVNGGGVRFRSVLSRETVNGMVFQNYINHEADIKSDLEALPVLYERGELKELSRIIIENIKILPSKTL